MYLIRNDLMENENLPDFWEPGILANKPERGKAFTLEGHPEFLSEVSMTRYSRVTKPSYNAPASDFELWDRSGREQHTTACNADVLPVK